MGPVTTASTMDPRRPYCRIMDDAAVVRAATLPTSVRNGIYFKSLFFLAQEFDFIIFLVKLDISRQQSFCR